MKLGRLIFWVIILLCLSAPDWGTAGESEEYLQITGPCDLVFPEDHGAHPGYRTEWWYYTGNVRSADGREFGYQLTFFRSAIQSSRQPADRPDPASAWRFDQIYLAHAAVTDIKNHVHHHAELTCREALGMAGVFQDTDRIRVRLKNWSTEVMPDAHALRAYAEPFSFELTLTPLKPPVLHGLRGYSRKGARSESASCYYSLTRMKTSGKLTVGDKEISVEGDSWMDHEFSSAPLESDLEGWDWFSLQLDDDSELMVYLLRKKDGSYSPASCGTFVKPSGESVHLDSAEFDITVQDTWTSSDTRAVYPSKWEVRILPESIRLVITPTVPDQEMTTEESTKVTYWEGSVSARGSRNERPINGRGYVELTGYEKPFDAPM